MMRTSLWLSVVLSLVACTGENQVAEGETEATIEMDTPRAADWMPAGSVEVTGTAEGLTDVKVDGQPAGRDGDRFSAFVELERGVNVVEARGKDAHGYSVFARHGVLAGTFADPGRRIEDAATVRVNRSGVETLLDTAATMVVLDDLKPALAGANPVYEDAYGIAGWDAVTLRADLTDLYFAPISIDGVPQYGVMSVTIALPDLWVELNATGDVIGWAFDETAWMWADTAWVTGNLAVGVTGGHLDVVLLDADIQLVGFGYDTSLLPGAIEQYLFVETVRGAIEDKLVAELQARVPAILSETLTGLELSYSTELLGKDVSVAGEFASASIDPDGLEIGLDLDVDVPGDGGHTYAGYLSSEKGVPMVDRTSDMAFALSDDLLNRVLFEAWRAGMLKIDLSTADGSLEPLMLAGLKAEEGEIHVDAKLPPVVVEKDGKLQAQITELEVTIETPGGDLGNTITVAMTLLVDLRIGAEDGVLALDLEDPEVAIVVRESDWGASNEATTQLLEELLPIESLLSLFSDVEIPLPVLAGVAIDSAQVSRDKSAVYTDVRIALD